MTKDVVTIPEVLDELTVFMAEYEPHWDANSKDLLSAALAEGTAELPDTLRDDPEFGEKSLWHLEQKAFLFLRLEMEGHQLTAHHFSSVEEQDRVVDPNGWNMVPKTFLPKSIFDSFEFAGNTDAAHVSAATSFYLSLKQAYVFRRQFEAWISKRLIVPAQSAWQRNAIKRAVLVLWGGVPPASGVIKAKTRDRQIVDWLSKNAFKRSKADTFSPATIRRALRELRVERSQLKN